MDWMTLACPRCETRDQFLLSAEKDRHLRQCSDCGRWFVVETGTETESDRGHRIDLLDHPPTCPVEGCEEVLDPPELPPHIIDAHDGELA